MKICGIDIDGVLNHYPKTWIDFVNTKLNKNFSSLSELKSNLAYQKYVELKELYRLSGIKETFIPRKGAVEFTKKLKKNNYAIVLFTTRPIATYPTLLKQTLEWLKKNKFEMDALVWDKIEVPWSIFDFVIEDELDMANKIAEKCNKVYLIDNDNNKSNANENIRRVKGFDEIEI